MNLITPSPLEGNAQRSGASFFDVLASAVVIPLRTPQPSVPGTQPFAWDADSENASQEDQENGRVAAGDGTRGKDQSAGTGVVMGNGKSSTQAMLPLPLHMRSNSTIPVRASTKEMQPQLSATALAAKIAASVALAPAVAASAISPQPVASAQQAATSQASDAPVNVAAIQIQLTASTRSVAYLSVVDDLPAPVAASVPAAVIGPPVLQPKVSMQATIPALTTSTGAQRAESPAASTASQLPAVAARTSATEADVPVGALARLSASPAEVAVAPVAAAASLTPALANAAPRQSAQGAEPIAQQSSDAASWSATSQAGASARQAATALSSAGLADISSLVAEPATPQGASPLPSSAQESSVAVSIPTAAVTAPDFQAQILASLKTPVFSETAQPAAAGVVDRDARAATESGFVTGIGVGTRAEATTPNSAAISTGNRMATNSGARTEAASDGPSGKAAQRSSDPAWRQQGDAAANSSDSSGVDLALGVGATASMTSGAALGATNFVPGAANALTVADIAIVDETAQANRLSADSGAVTHGAAGVIGQAKNQTVPVANQPGSAANANTGANAGVNNSANGGSPQHAQTDAAQVAPAASRVGDASPVQMQQMVLQGSSHDTGTARGAADTGAQELREDRASQADQAARDQALQAQAADGQTSSAINTARVLQSMSGSEMRMGMHSAEFGDISIRTTVSQQQMTAQIAVDHGDLGKAISAHLPAMQEKLGGELGIRASVEVSQSGMSFSGERGYSSERDQRTNAPHTSFEASETMQEAEFAGYKSGASLAVEGSRLDIRA